MTWANVGDALMLAFVALMLVLVFAMLAENR